MADSQQALVDALFARQKQFSRAIDRLRELASAEAEAENEVYDATLLLRESIELVGCLRRLVAKMSVTEIHRAFGAPGDFGYETPIGDALAWIYRGEVRS